jgi:hypothetical protein
VQGREKSAKEVSMHPKSFESEMKDKNFLGVDSSRYLGIDQKFKVN